MEEIIKYSYYDEVGNYCVVIDSDKLKVKYNIDRIYIDTEE